MLGLTLFSLVLQVAQAAPCPGSPQGYYSPNPYTYHAGVPAANDLYNFVLQPDFLTCAEIDAINTHCIAQINRYRSGELVFSNGESDEFLGRWVPVVAIELCYILLRAIS
jgi:hypothetical protein